MLSLAIEFSSSHRSVAVFRDKDRVGSVCHEWTRGQDPLALVDAALGGIPFVDVDRIVVGVGPGSYTGIRMAIALGIGFRASTGAELVAVRSFDSMALQLVRGHEGEVDLLCVDDAQRGQLVCGRYRSQAGQLMSREKLELIDVDALDEQVIRRPCLVGLSPGLAVKLAIEACPDGSKVISPRAQDALEIVNSNALDLETELAPIYLRETSFVKAPLPSPFPDLA